MKIGQPPEIPPSSPQPQSQAVASAGQAQVQSARGDRKTPGVGLTVSEAARALEQAGVASEAEFDAVKVEQVRQAIASGTYAVNPEAIADRLLANAQEMLRRSLT